ncbi:glycosyltransferase family 4 protein [Nonlabens agnitus]|nr:glycosyltransferase family 4 protein [Nonlabens agnitus]
MLTIRHHLVVQMQTRVLYIGNQLASKNRTATTIDTLSDLLRKQGYQVKTASSVKNQWLRGLHMAWVTLLNRNWAQFVLIDTYSTRNFWYAISIGYICRWLNIKYIPILHGGNLPARLKTNPKVFHHFLSNAHRVVSPSDYLKFAFEERSDEEVHAEHLTGQAGSRSTKANFKKITVIQNSLELENYDFNKRSRVQPKLLWVRSFAEIYNPMMALKVLERLLEQLPNACLTMVGPDKDGSLQRCEQYALEKGLPVHFTGLLSKTEWIALSREHDIFINTSHFDNMPVSILEAMALGLPVISTNVGGIPILIQNESNGLLVDDDDVIRMVESIISLTKNQELANRLSTNAYILVGKFSWDTIKNSWNELLRS